MKKHTAYVGKLIYDVDSPMNRGVGWVESHGPATYKIHWQDGRITCEYYLFVQTRYNKYLEFRQNMK